MIDITEVTGQGLQLFDTQVPRAANILNIQLGSLEYAPLLGIDLRYFLDNVIEFQNESFQAYLIEILANAGINVTEVSTTINALYAQYGIVIAEQKSSTSLLAR
jgi:hypothetical protein